MIMDQHKTQIRIGFQLTSTQNILSLEGKGANFTGIALGNDNPYIVGLDESTEGQIALVADGVVPVIATAQGLIPGNNNIDIGSSSGKRFKNVYAEIFDGTATQAQYADLAENYLADNQYEVGTVLIFGGEQELTQRNYTMTQEWQVLFQKIQHT